MQAIKYGKGKYSMIYHDFGKTGFRISALGFGAMRLPIPENADREATADLGDAVELLRHGIRSGSTTSTPPISTATAAASSLSDSRWRTAGATGSPSPPNCR